MSTIGNNIPPTIPFHIARAYGVQPANRVGGTGGSTASAPTRALASSPGPAAKLPTSAQKLVGATVPGKVDFSGALPAPSAGSLQMYHHPADRNAAATAVTIGRSLDVSG